MAETPVNLAATNVLSTSVRLIWEQGLGIIGPTSISGGGSHSLALKDDGTVVGWGWDYYDQSSVPSGLVAYVPA
jgi:alpha-tubulin suppressor-like RCC1 family protein